MKNQKTNETKKQALETATAQTLFDNVAFPSRKLSRKDHKEFYTASGNLLKSLYTQAVNAQSGKDTTQEKENNIKGLRAILQGLGKVNGKYISAFEKVDNKGTFLFDSLLHHSYKFQKITTNAELASLLCDRQTAKKIASEKLEKDDIQGYKKAKANADKLAKRIDKLKETTANAEKLTLTIESSGTFTRFFEQTLQGIIANIMAKPLEEIEKERKERNASKKAEKKAEKTKTKTKTETKKAPKTKTETAKAKTETTKAA